jgi:ubiquitin related modifier 1
MELLFEDKRFHKVSVPSIGPDGKSVNMAYLIRWIRDNLLKERVDLFMEGDTVYAIVLLIHSGLHTD